MSWLDNNFGVTQKCFVCQKEFVVVGGEWAYDILNAGVRKRVCSYYCIGEYDKNKKKSKYITIKEEFEFYEILHAIKKNISYSELAFVINVTLGTIQKWNSGDNVPNRKHFERLKEYYEHIK